MSARRSTVPRGLSEAATAGTGPRRRTAPRVGSGPVWRVALAGLRRRRLQTVVIGLVVLFSTATITVALGLLAVASGPFDRAFAQHGGAHVTASFDSRKVTHPQLARAAHRSGVSVAAGPFDEAVLEAPPTADAVTQPSLTVVGRAGPDGPVDRLELWRGRWATRPGEIVLNAGPDTTDGAALGTAMSYAGAPTLTVVGYASSITGTADGWVAPEQMTSLHPTATQMLYRFTTAATAGQVAAHLSAVTSDLPRGALLGSQSYLSVKAEVAGGPGTYIPFLLAFGVLGLVVAVLIVANVVTGAVVAGYRHIGVLKALGFTPAQVLAVYQLMVFVPTAVGTLVGTAVGNAVAVPLVHSAFAGFGAMSSRGVTVPVWADVACLVGMPALVALTAMVPALRARRVSAVQAITAGSAPRATRGLRIQRWLSGTRLPRAVSLGLGLPFTRPARSVLTLAAVILGVTTATFATGLATTLTRYGDAVERNGSVQVEAYARGPGGAVVGQADARTERMLRSLPGTVHVTADGFLALHAAGYTEPVYGDFYRGDSDTLGWVLARGHWMRGPDEVVVTSQFLHLRGLAVGDRLTLQSSGRQVPVRIVGETMVGPPDRMFGDWRTLSRLTPQPKTNYYEIQVAPGVDVDGYMSRITKADPSLLPMPRDGVNGAVALAAFAGLFTLLLGAVAALGVFNTVALDTQERRRDLGMLKSIGMTPRQVVAMMVTSMALLGAVGGILGPPAGVVAYRLIVPAMTRPKHIDMPASFLDVWHVPVLALLALVGLVITVLGALIPARAAARLTIATVLHNE
ncbi:MAG: ABC transporter permease [Actinocatenispora sp.]